MDLGVTMTHGPRIDSISPYGDHSISRPTTIQESREWLTIFLVYGALAIVLAPWAHFWLTFEPPMIHSGDSEFCRLCLAALMGEPLVIGLCTVEWRDDE